MSMSRREDLTGRKFGNLTAVKFVERRAGKTVWQWLCDCGRTKEAWASHVKEGRVKSCGCANLVARRSKPDWHGMTGSPEHRTWTNMHTRCGNPNSDDFANYGGRGIKVCDSWADFKKFYADMGGRPEGTTIDRIDGNGNYEPTNCRWADKKTQVDNRSISVWIEHDGRRMVLADWARHFGVSPNAIRKRMNIHGTLDGYKPYANKRKGRV